MAQDYFHRASAIRDDEKYFDVSLAEIDREVARDGYAEYETAYYPEEVADPVLLRLNVSCQSPLATAWSASLKLHGKRIDCIDFEGRFDAADGSVGRGWHRHLWDDSAGDAELGKVPLPSLTDISSQREFILRVLSEFKIVLNRQDNAQDLGQLPLD